MGSVRRVKVDIRAQRDGCATAVLSVLPVLLVAYVCCSYARAELLLGLFLVEWMLVLAAWGLLCPWLGNRRVLLAAVPFLLSFCVSAILVRESMAVNEAVWDWSDDYWYLGGAARVMDSLRSSGWNLSEAWSLLTSAPGGASWTLAGWPYLLGLVSSLVTSDTSPEVLHAIALSLNAFFLSLVLALVFHLLEESAERFPWMALVCFLLLIVDPIVYASYSRKESMLQLALMLVFALSFKLSKRISVCWVALGLLGMAGVVTSRPGYIPLLLLLIYWMMLDKIQLGVVPKNRDWPCAFCVIWWFALEF